MHAQSDGQPRISSSGQGESDPLQDPAEQWGASGIGAGQSVDLLDEGPATAFGGRAQEPTHSQYQATGPVTDRRVGEGAVVSTEDPPRHTLALRTRCGLRQRGHPDADTCRGCVDGFDRDSRQVWE